VKKIYVVSAAFLILSILCCIPSIENMVSPPEAAVQITNGHFLPSLYLSLLQNLTTEGYRFVLPQEVLGKNVTGKVAVVIHDVDLRWQGAEVLVSVEKQMGIRSCFFLRPDAEYFDQAIPYFQGLQAEGWEIGMHYDALSRSMDNLTQANTLFTAQLAYMRTFFNVTLTHYHGDGFLGNQSLLIRNYWLYGNYTGQWKSLGLEDMQTMPAPFTYITDVNGVWHNPPQRLDILFINIHGDWWYFN
jgi:hypothetical protein